MKFECPAEGKCCLWCSDVAIATKSCGGCNYQCIECEAGPSGKSVIPHTPECDHFEKTKIRDHYWSDECIVDVWRCDNCGVEWQERRKVEIVYQTCSGNCIDCFECEEVPA